MPDIIAVGASAGGLDPLKKMVAALPRDLPATIFIVQHMLATAESCLAQILDRCSALPVGFAVDGETIEYGRIYVAPPDRHLLVGRGHIHVSAGPRENFCRPSVNPLFRSAASIYGERAAGVVLSGQLDDGVSGLWELKRRGGTTIVQDPHEAVAPSMPESALSHVKVDYVVRASELGSLLAELAGETLPGAPAIQEFQPTRSLSDLTCPDCRGTLWKEEKDSIIEYSCRVGHTFTERTMRATHVEAQERALWAAIVALEEGASLLRQLVEQGGDNREQLIVEAEQKLSHAATLRRIVNRG